MYIKAKIQPTYDEKGREKKGKEPVFPNERKKSHEDNSGLQMLMKHSKEGE